MQRFEFYNIIFDTLGAGGAIANQRSGASAGAGGSATAGGSASASASFPGFPKCNKTTTFYSWPNRRITF